MNDFVTLNCPSCGGKLNVQKNSPTYVCEYCGTEHRIREEDIEYFGRCPKCHRNDRVEKISAIVNRHDQLAAKFPSPDQLNLDKYVKRPDLAVEQSLNTNMTAPIKANRYRTRSKVFFIMTGMLLFFTFCLIGTGSYKGKLSIFLVVSLIGVFVVAYFGIYNFIKGEIEQKDLETTSLEQEMLTQRREVNNHKSLLIQKLKSRYGKIYYCHRDDLLFIPGEEGFASCEDFEVYLTNMLETN